ncbi:bifunctional acetate--CoA ligase family protein/GNAT family N-acetyltransferase [Thiohalomonas denitrificans]|uniref:Acetyltransferase n=1 Tax=Thiohalomonas denitrificans TaxID=415747 RepID=A0A1G5QCR9_9GAMM|nr:bifunctional acetate--CoA ligase family protein/GNAT family N-acetyltransferase [Thiohalomonas denitrificans]SCZ59685.1 acetyltransferase [Thiohalomonas denitrificans]
MAQHYLKQLFEPESMAIFGASDRPDSVGALVFQNMLEGGFKGPVFPINPKHEKVRGQKAYASIDEVHQPVDLAVIATPAPTVPNIIEACGAHGIRRAVILSAGFREVGSKGRKLEQAVLENARRYGIRFLGPNCLGVMRPGLGVNATFNKGGAKEGRLGLVSQSGALCTAILDWAAANDVGFSTVISTGISADLDFGEILDYLVADPKTNSILLYIEGIHNSRSFVSGLRAAARIKPVIALKVGRHAAGSRAAESHTGALVGSDDVFDAALRRAGVVRGMRIGHLFAAAQTLTSRFRAEGERLAVVTNGGGPGVMATDRAEDLGIPMAELSEASLGVLDQALPGTWSHGNPVDVIGDASVDRYVKALEVCLADRGVDGVLVILTPQAMTRPMEVAEGVVEVAKKAKKPVLTCWMGQIQVSESREWMRRSGLPSFQTPEAAVEAFSYLTAYYRNQHLLLQTPGPVGRRRQPDVEGARLIIESALADGRNVLSEVESKAILGAFQVRTGPAVVVRSPGEALIQAESMGFPVALKINSRDITHKSDAGGVRLGISNAQGVRSAYNELINEVTRRRPEARIDGVTIEPMELRPNGRELLVGLITDPLFGPVITFGSGGTAVEVMGDRAVTLPPLNHFLVADLIRRTRVSKSLGAFRHMPPADMQALESVLMRVSEMACELPWVRELDINPLIVDENGAVAVDARIVVDYPTVGQGPYGHMAIYPYPVHLMIHWQTPDGLDVVIRPIRPEDAEIEQAFVRRLSERAKYFRFMQTLEELTPAMLARFTQIDYDREMALIAVLEEEKGEIQLGVCRYIINPDGISCEFAVVVADEWQHRGIGHRLMVQLMEAARERGLKRMEGEVLADNHEMLALVRSVGFTVITNEEDPKIKSVYRAL